MIRIHAPEHFCSYSLPCVSRNPGSLQLYRPRELLLHRLDKYGEQAIKRFVSKLLRIWSHESNTKRAWLWLGTKIFLCPITDKDFNWFRAWSVKSRIPGAPLSLLLTWPLQLPHDPTTVTAPGSPRMTVLLMFWHPKEG